MSRHLGSRRRRVAAKSSQNLIRVEPLRRLRHGSVSRANPAQHHREIPRAAVRGFGGGSNPGVAAPRREGAPPARRLRPRRLLLDKCVHPAGPAQRVWVLGELNLAPNDLRHRTIAAVPRLHLRVRRSDHDLSFAEREDGVRPDDRNAGFVPLFKVNGGRDVSAQRTQRPAPRQPLQLAHAPRVVDPSRDGPLVRRRRSLTPRRRRAVTRRERVADVNHRSHRAATCFLAIRPVAVYVVAVHTLAVHVPKLVVVTVPRAYCDWKVPRAVQPPRRVRHQARQRPLGERRVRPFSFANRVRLVVLV
mmetsp:Transcript_15309/g.59862  ORF Transcript_15309/g.59862 Transcript_15309/m.59862 type:complete len:304 (-) Transcript_15309:73-984(-)